MSPFEDEIESNKPLGYEHDSTVKHGSCGHRHAGSARPAGGFSSQMILNISRLEQPLHASAHHGALSELAHSACNCSLRRYVMRSSCAPSMQVRTTAPPSELARPAARVELHELRAEAPQRRLIEIKRAEST